MRWVGLSNARLSAAGKHLWCLHLPFPAEKKMFHMLLILQYCKIFNLFRGQVCGNIKETKCVSIMVSSA